MAWNPFGVARQMTPSGDVELAEVWVRQDSNFTNTSIISVFKKIKDNPDYNQQIVVEKEKGICLQAPPGTVSL